jgi:hypothetical protein
MLNFNINIHFRCISTMNAEHENLDNSIQEIDSRIVENLSPSLNYSFNRRNHY